MRRVEARRILGNQPKGALHNMTKALQIHPWGLTPEGKKRLEALRALGYGRKRKTKS